AAAQRRSVQYPPTKTSWKLVLQRQPGSDQPEDGIQAHILRFASGASHQFDLAFLDFLAHRNPERYAYQVGVVEFNAGAFVSIPDQPPNPGQRDFLINLLPNGGLIRVFDIDRGNHYMEWRNRSGPYDPRLVVVQLDGSDQHSLNSNAVATHDDGGLCAIGRQHGCVHRLGVFGAQFEYVADLHRFEYPELAVAGGAALAGLYRPEVGPLPHGDVSIDVNAPQVIVIPVRSGCHVAAAAQGMISDDFVDCFVGGTGYADRSKRAGQRAQRHADLFRLGGSDIQCAGSISQLGLVQLMIAAHQYQCQVVVEYVHKRLYLAICGCASFEFDQRLDSPDTGRRKRLGALGTPVITGHCRKPGGSLFYIGRVPAFGTGCDQVLAGIGPHHEFS